VYINLKGRQPHGSVEPSDYGRLRAELVGVLESATDADSGRAAVDRVWCSDEIYHGPETVHGPDLLVSFRYDGPCYGLSVGNVTARASSASFSGTPGGHRLHGILAAAGSELRSSVRADGVTLYNIAPTILHLLGHPKAGALDGRVLLEALAKGPDEEQVPTETHTLHVANGTYRAALQVTETAGRRYLDKSWRE
jgi:predicted AlkP superfamily phosphohydrolase/phosphomutase